MESGKERKVCFIASSGGHWEELMCLKSVAQKYDAFYVTEEGGQANDASANLDKIYTFPQINRYESGFVKHFIRLFVSARKLLKQEKPDVVITTGALIAFPFCLLAKLSGSKVVYILLILLPIALLFAESSMNNLQSVSIVAAFPIGVVIVMIAVSFIKDAKNYMEELGNKK